MILVDDADLSVLRKRHPSSPQSCEGLGTTDGVGYDAFISYSHAADGQLAPALQAAMQSIAKTWYQRRSLRVFRDATSLAVSPELWPSIERAMERSRYFVLFASPESAASKWVAQEVAWWRAHRASDALLIVLTDGELRWDDDAGDFSASSAVPPSLRGWLHAEPLWVDLRWEHDAEHFSTRDPRFRDGVAALVAAIRGIDKDELVGEDIRQHRRTVRLARAAAVILGVLTITAVVGGILAETQHRRADTQSTKAHQQKSEKTSLALTSLASRVLESQPDVSLLLALEAYRANPRAEARSSVLAGLAAARNPGVLARMRGRGGDLVSTAFSRNGRLLASASGDEIQLWDARTHEPFGAPMTGYDHDVLSLAFSANGRTLAAGNDDGAVRLWDVRTRKLRGTPLRVSSDFVQPRLEEVAFSPDGRTLAAGSTGIQLWDVHTHKRRGAPLNIHASALSSLAFSGDGRTLASASEDKTIRLWNARTHKQRGAALIGHTDSVSSVAFTPDGHTLASGSWDKTIRLWDLRTHKQRGRLTRHSEPVSSVAFSGDGRTLASGSWDKTIRLWDVRTHKQRGAALTGHTSFVKNVAFSEDGRTLASASTDEMMLWDARVQQARGYTLAGHTGVVTSVAFAADGGMLATGSTDDTVRLWDMHTHKQLGAPLTGHRDDILSVTFSEDMRTLASGSADGTVRIWDVRTHKQRHEPLNDHDYLHEDVLVDHDDVLGVAFSPDRRTLASAGVDIQIRVWDLVARSHKTLGVGLDQLHHGAVYSLAFSADARTLASASTDRTVRLWDTRTGKQLGSPLSGHTDDVLSVAFSPDGQILASAGLDSTIRLWNVRTHKPLGEPLTDHTDDLLDVAFSRDGRTLASAGRDNTIRLWDVRTHTPLGAPLAGHSDDVNSVAFSPDGRTLASASADGLVRVWDKILWRSFAELQADVCDLVGKGLSRTEWAHYANGVPYRPSCA